MASCSFTKKIGKLAALLAASVLLASGAAAQAADYGKYGSATEFGWSTYFKYHPAKRHMNPYPFEGAVIKAGEDIPVCEAAKLPEAYLYKKEVRVISHGKDGWLFRTADYRTDFEANKRALGYFMRLNKALTQKGQTLVVTFQPPRAWMGQAHLDPASIPKGYNPADAQKGYHDFLQQLRSAGIVAVDMAGANPPGDYFPSGDFHWTPAGAAYAAQQIAEVVKKLSGYNRLDKQEFVSRISGPAKIPTRGAFENFIQNTCKVNIEMKQGQVWETEPVATQGKGESSLLDDSAGIPAVTVIGTSNSAEDEKFNFIGSLKHYLRTDVYNAAIVAGGFGSSPYRYLSSDEYKNYPPKFVIWEFLPQHEYNSDESALAFRQMIPATYGACSENAALATASIDIKNPETDLFADMEKRQLQDAYLYMEVTEPAERSLKIDILYGDGNADRVDMTRSTRAVNNGKYFLDLAGNSDKPMIFFHLITDKAQGHINARLCRYPVSLASN